MPLVKIHLRKGWSSRKKKELNQAIHQALRCTLEIDYSDYYHRIFEFGKEDFICPENKSKKFMIIELHLFPGRSKKTKQKMYMEICDRLENLGCIRSEIFIQVLEQPLHNWSTKGGISNEVINQNKKKKK